MVFGCRRVAQKAISGKKRLNLTLVRADTLLQGLQTGRCKILKSPLMNQIQVKVANSNAANV